MEKTSNQVTSLEEFQKKVAKMKAEFFLPPLRAHKYTLLDVIGEGAYGIVCSAIDNTTGEKVAVKRIMKVFDEIPEAVRILRELKFLRFLREHENIIKIKDVLLPGDRDNFNDVFVVFELMPTDLNRVLRSKIELSSEHIRWLMYQLLRGIHYLHTARVFHRDLKPNNILINAECDLRICDFGMSSFFCRFLVLFGHAVHN
jgi:serine/threonine protein kinase